MQRTWGSFDDQTNYNRTLNILHRLVLNFNKYSSDSVDLEALLNKSKKLKFNLKLILKLLIFSFLFLFFMIYLQ